MTMLAGLLYDEMRQEMWQSYTAQMLYYANFVAFKRAGAEFRHPTWLDMTEDAPQDERTGREIVNDLAEKFRRRAERR